MPSKRESISMVALTSKMPSSMVSRGTSKVPPPMSWMILDTFMLEMVPHPW